ncbi:XRE family transcriptional regulator [Streptomyces sp. P1-3]|uniref:XRE family transcriptional regulator n=1 Tax=Streptomyces sp. P1-3 TaxID=3421658 RepID=UPI003D36D3E7
MGEVPDVTDGGSVEGIRAASRRLVALDNDPAARPAGARSAVDQAAAAFAVVRHRLREGHDGRGRNGPGERAERRERLAAAAELAEVAGWLHFDAGRYRAAARLETAALTWARRAGDRATELLTLQNAALRAGWIGHPRTELAIARAVLDRRRLTPRLEAVFRIREARGLAATGRATDAARSFARARSLLLDGERPGDPPWVWWVTADEIDGHQGGTYQKAGDWARAIPLLHRAALQQSGVTVGYSGIFGARLLAAFLGAGAWREAVRTVEELVPTVAGTGSGRTLELLRTAAAYTGRLPSAAPARMRDALHWLGGTLPPAAPQSDRMRSSVPVPPVGPRLNR